MKRIGQRTLSGALLFWLAACGSMSAAEEAPAVIPKPTAETKAALQRAVSTLLKRESVLLADDALTSESELMLEPSRPRDGQGIPIQGRELRSPERFHLVKRGRECILVHENNGERLTLATSECVQRK